MSIRPFSLTFLSPGEAPNDDGHRLMTDIDPEGHRPLIPEPTLSQGTAMRKKKKKKKERDLNVGTKTHRSTGSLWGGGVRRLRGLLDISLGKPGSRHPDGCRL